MTPLDDELRTTLSSRAATVAPSPDPLAGVEARATRIRRTRAALAAGGAALAVAAVAVAVPALDAGHGSGRHEIGATPSATSGPASWPYRGNTIPAGTLDAFQQKWDAQHPGSTLTPLFGQVYEPSATQQLVFVAGDRVGVIQSSSSGPELLYDEPSRTPEALAFVLAGDETPRVLVVGDPGSSAAVTDDARQGAFRPLAPIDSGVSTGPIGSQHPWLVVKVTHADGGQAEVEPYDFSKVPANLLTWGVRGRDPVSPDTMDLRRRFAQAFGRTDVDRTEYSPLYVDQVDGVAFTVGQAWFEGADTAYTVSYALASDNVPQFFVGPATPTDPWGLAFLVSGMASHDLLVVVPRPGVGQVLYAPHATGAFQPVASGRSDLNGVALVERDLQASDDRLQVLDGDGNLDHPLYEGGVTPLLCGLKECG